MAAADRVTNVYVISEGERGEGSTPIAAVRSLQAARQYVHDNWLRDLTPGDATNHWWAQRQHGNDVDLIHVHRLRVGGAS